MAWVELHPTKFGPDATKLDEERVMSAANSTRQRMADELQGRVSID